MSEHSGSGGTSLGNSGGSSMRSQPAVSSSSSGVDVNEDEMEVEHDGASGHDGVRGAAALDGASPAGTRGGAPPPLLDQAGAASAADEMIDGA
jgi:hypothetical protein